MKIIDSPGMAEIDRASVEDYGIPSPVLMENAGIRCWDAFKRVYSQDFTPGSRLVFLAGSGNNGGDALVMARHAYLEGRGIVSVISGSVNSSGEGARQKDICRRLEIPILEWPENRAACLKELSLGNFLIDGLTGTGIRGALRSPIEEIIREANGSPGKKIALDVPSGLGDSWQQGFPVFQAERTFTIGLPLTCLYLPRARRFCGTIEVIPISFPTALTGSPKIPGELVSWDDQMGELHFPPEDAYKNKRGHAGIFAGGEGTSGAAVLASEAAARSLAGLVTLHTPGRVWAAAASACRSVMVKAWDSGQDPNSCSLDKYDALLAGPGWGQENPPVLEKWLLYFFKSGIPGVLDADGLRIFSRMKDPAVPANRWVFTPHPGEFSALTGREVKEILENPLGPVLNYARERGVVVVLKTNVVFIGFPDGRYRIVDGENSAMGTGGTGDILAGIIAGFLAAGCSPETAAAAGSALHQRIGRTGRDTLGWFLSQDLLPLISITLAGEDKS